MQIIYVDGQCLKNSFKWKTNISMFDEKFIKNYDEDSEQRYIFEVGVEYLKTLHDLHSDLPFLPKRMTINKCNKLVCNLYDKKNYVVHIRVLKKALNNRLILKKVHKVIEFNQEPWVKPYIDMNTRLKKEAKSYFEKDFYKLMNNAIFGRTMENVRNHRDIRLVTTNQKKK